MKKFKFELHRLPTELVYPFFGWSQEEPGTDARDEAWDRYCDVRDGLPTGFSRAFRLKHSWAAGEVHLDADNLNNVFPMKHLP